MTHFDEKSLEIERLKGELAASSACIGFLFQLVIKLFGGGDFRSTIISKIRDFPIDDVSTVSDDWIDGVNRFKKRLLDGLSDDTLNGTD